MADDKLTREQAVVLEAAMPDVPLVWSGTYAGTYAVISNDPDDRHMTRDEARALSQAPRVVRYWRGEAERLEKALRARDSSDAVVRQDGVNVCILTGKPCSEVGECIADRCDPCSARARLTHQQNQEEQADA